MTDIAALVVYMNNQDLCLLDDHLLHSHDLIIHQAVLL